MGGGKLKCLASPQDRHPDRAPGGPLRRNAPGCAPRPLPASSTVVGHEHPAPPRLGHYVRACGLWRCGECPVRAVEGLEGLRVSMGRRGLGRIRPPMASGPVNGILSYDRSAVGLYLDQGILLALRRKMARLTVVTFLYACGGLRLFLPIRGVSQSE